MNHPDPSTTETAVVYPSVITAAHAQAPLVHLPTQAGPAPLPGAELVTVPGVGRVWAYTDPRPDTAPAAQPEPLPTWVKATALLMPSTAVSVAVGAWGLSLAVAAFEAIAAALWALAGAVATVGLVVGGTALAWRSARRTTTGSARSGPITATATATATSRALLGGKATATATSTVRIDR